jgi:hypothetical protein
MNKVWAPLCAAFFVSGCGGLDPSKLIPSAVASFQTTVGAETATEVSLIAAFQLEDRTLQYLSNSTYNCGDPNSPIYKYYIGTKDPSALVTAEHVNKYWSASITYVQSYLALLTGIANQAKSDQTQIQSVVAIGTQAAKAIPNISSAAAGTALSTLSTVLVDGINLAAAERVREASVDAQKPLEQAVGYLKKYSPAFIANEQKAFNAWDECANEKLLFIRDQPLGKIKSYQQKLFIPANGFDLENSYLAYQAQRKAFLLTATVKTIDAQLDEIVKQNKNLGDPAVNLQTLQSLGTTLNQLYTDISAAAAAVQQFGTTKKPVTGTGAGAKSAHLRSQPLLVAENNAVG